MKSIDELAKRISVLPRAQKTLLIAIDGRGGSGKSTLAEQLKQRLENASVVHLDDFAYPETDRDRLLKQVILPLKEDQAANYQRFDWGTKQLAEWHEITPGGIVIIEGVSALHDMLSNHYDFRIWIECPPEVGFKRGLHRDKTEYRVDNTSDWLNVWKPEEKRYVETHKPQDKADYIVDGTEEK